VNPSHSVTLPQAAFFGHLQNVFIIDHSSSSAALCSFPHIHYIVVLLLKKLFLINNKCILYLNLSSSIISFQSVLLLLRVMLQEVTPSSLESVIGVEE
jgi:glucan phosphoethanolaminetransferase (alkaline phosphatase superfamily)